MEIVGTFWVYAFMDNEVFPVFLWGQRMKAVGASQGVGFGKAAPFRAEQGGAYFAHDLVFGTVVFIKIWFGSIAARTGAAIVYIALRTAFDRLYCFAVPPLDVWDVFPVIPWFIVDGFGKFVYLEFLVFRGVRVIESPLSERDVSANEVKKLADNFVLTIDVLK